MAGRTNSQSLCVFSAPPAGNIATTSSPIVSIFGLSTFPSAVTEEKEEYSLGLLQMTQLSPLGIVDANEGGRLALFSLNQERYGHWIISWGEPWAPIACKFLTYGLLLFGVRWLCLRMAEPWLHRGARR